MTPVQIVKLRKTTEQRPSQWEGRLNDGQDIFIRYRHGEFSVRVSDDLLQWDRDWAEWVEALVVSELVEDGDPNVMDTATMLARLPAWITTAPGLVVREGYE